MSLCPRLFGKQHARSTVIHDGIVASDRVQVFRILTRMISWPCPLSPSAQCVFCPLIHQTDPTIRPAGPPAKILPTEQKHNSQFWDQTLACEGTTFSAPAKTLKCLCGAALWESFPPFPPLPSPQRHAPDGNGHFELVHLVVASRSTWLVLAQARTQNGDQSSEKCVCLLMVQCSCGRLIHRLPTKLFYFRPSHTPLLSPPSHTRHSSCIHLPSLYSYSHFLVS